ncbi:excise [Gordonia phage Mollymur]|uniref:Excise n=1 Tax=Gordonia phage Mollymur TaxID=2590895 RepID=A0A4Y6E9V7_9CAUD|nr:excise [Gordonia phage Mollymur]QDF15453.1 excise [Gordonia phage Mollymur]
MTRLGHSKQQAADIVGVSEQTITRAINAGLLGAKKIGSRIVIPDQELRDWFDSLPSALAD